MIPELNQSGLLPPFINEPTNYAGSTPYKSTITDFVRRYAQSLERIIILKGLLEYRRKLTSIGITDGFQWLNGSFVEDIELNRHRTPSDVDVVTFGMPPTTNEQEWNKILTNNKELFYPGKHKEKFQCDAYFINLNTHPKDVVSATSYWLGLLSHQRDTQIWKGIVQVPIICSDKEALKILDEETNHV